MTKMRDGDGAQLGCFAFSVFHRSTEWHREMRDGVREAGRRSEGSGVFRLVKRCVCTFFFFFWISAWLGRFGRFGWYRPIRPIRTESARFGTSHVARTRGLRRPSRVAASRRVRRRCARLGAASVHPRYQTNSLVLLGANCQIVCVSTSASIWKAYVVVWTSDKKIEVALAIILLSFFFFPFLTLTLIL